jgi:dTDP-4-amino-4,6-dideoxygalactose transaminase
VKLPLLVPALPAAARLLPYLARIDAARRYTNFGPLNAEFEQRIAGEAAPAAVTAQVATVANATLGLELALQSMDLPAGARVAVPAITFVATATAVRRAGLEPLLCDVDPATWCLTPALAAEALRHGARAALPVATFGAALDAEAWDRLAATQGVRVLVDAAGAFGSQRIGAHADVVFSFHATKSFGIGEGGAFASASPSRVARVRTLSNFGIDLPSGLVEECGTNAKLSEYHAAVGLAAFEDWPQVRAARAALSARYRAALAAACPWLRFQATPHGAVDALLTVALPDTLDAGRAAAMLAARGIETRRWYCPPLHRHPAFAQAPRVGTLDVAERLSRALLGLPFFPGLSDAAIEYVAAALRDAAREAA